MNKKETESIKTKPIKSSNKYPEIKKVEIPPPPPPNIPDPPPDMPGTSEIALRTPASKKYARAPNKSDKDIKRGVTLNQIVEARKNLKNITDECSTLTAADSQKTLTKIIRGGVNIRSNTTMKDSKSTNNINYKAASLSDNAAAILSKHLNSINRCTQDSDSDSNSLTEEDPDKWD